MNRDKKFSFVVPYTDRDKKYLNRCTASIEEQDYGNVEVIAIHDKDGKGASWARNEGAKTATGEYLFFFDVDCVLQPGILMEISAIFDDYPDTDFVYGQYRFFGEALEVYPSRSWNPYVLESMNYISTMSPMKREMFDAVGGFREGLEYFQDWDFFIRAARSGRKGRFLRNVFFNTEEPGKDSISGNPKYDFRDKVRHIQEINGLPRKPICVTTFGAPFQAEYRAEVLGADYLGSNMSTELVQTPGLHGPHDWKMIYVMGFYPKAVDAHAGMFANASEECKKVIHWIGTDVHQLRVDYNWVSIQALKEDILSQMDAQFTTAPWLTQELAELGIDAPTLYAPIDPEKFPMTAPPKEFSVSCYVSDTNPVHNESFILDVAKSMRDVKFYFFGRNVQEKLNNVEYVGRVEDMKELIKGTSVNLRMPIHDGLPQTVVQYLLSGRKAVCNVPVKYANFLDFHPDEDNYASVKARVVWELRQIKNAKYNVAEAKATRAYWLKLTDPVRYREAINKVLNARNDNAEDDVRVADLQPGTVVSGNA